MSIRSRGIWRIYAGVDKTIIAMLEVWNVNSEYFLDVVGKVDLLDFDAVRASESILHETCQRTYPNG